MLTITLIVGLTASMEVARALPAQVLALTGQGLAPAGRAMDARAPRSLLPALRPRRVGPMIVGGPWLAGAAILTAA